MLDEADAQEVDAQEAPKGGARCLSPRALSGSSVCDRLGWAGVGVKSYCQYDDECRTTSVALLSVRQSVGRRD
jgi:hypothetical protein